MLKVNDKDGCIKLRYNLLEIEINYTETEIYHRRSHRPQLSILSAMVLSSFAAKAPRRGPIAAIHRALPAVEAPNAL